MEILEIDECVGIKNNCDRTLATCSSTLTGRFICTCIAGYTGEGTTGTCIGEYNSSLTNFAFLVCVYFPCYLDIDECAMDMHNCDEALAVCLNTPAGSFTCRCIAGYTGSGTAGTCFGEYLDSFS